MQNTACPVVQLMVYLKKAKITTKSSQIKNKIIDNEDKLCFNNSRQFIGPTVANVIKSEKRRSTTRES